MARNRLIYGMAVAALVLFIYLREQPMTYLALYAALIAPLISLLLSLVCRVQLRKRGGQQVLFLRNRFTVSESLQANFVAKGQPIQYIYSLKNNSFLPCTSVLVCFQSDREGLKVDDGEQYVSIEPYERQEVCFRIHAAYRGNYRVGVERIVYYDFLGLFKFQQKQDINLVFTVVPRIQNIPFLPLDSLIRDELSSKNHMLNEAYSIVSDLRKYQPTDSFKRIHWKVSAKRNELISKSFHEMERQAAILCIDNSAVEGGPKEALEVEDVMMDAFVSAMAYCNRMGYSVSLWALGQKEGDSSINFNYLFKTAATLPFGAAYELDMYLNQATSLRGDPINLILFLQDMSEGTFTVLRSLRLYGNHIIVFYFHHRTDRDKLNQLKEIGVHCIDFREL